MVQQSRKLLPIEAPAIGQRISRQLGAMVLQGISKRLEEPLRVERPARLEAWTRHFWSDGFQLASSPMHAWLFSQLDRLDAARGLKIAIEAPRGSGKSQVLTAYVLRCAVEGREPYIWLVSDADEQAEGNLEAIREQVEDNAYLKAAYPEATGKGGRWRSNRLDLSNGVTIQAFGMMARMRGRKKSSQRPTLIVGDDLQNDNIQTSGFQREKQQRRFDDVILNAGTPKTNLAVAGTALHRECIVENLKARPGWRSKTFSAITRWPQRLDLWEQWAAIYRDRETYGEDSDEAARAFYQEHRAEMDAGAEVLWPEHESLYQLYQRREEIGHASFEREKQNNPVNPETCFFPAEWFEPAVWFREWPADSKAWVCSLDPSLGNTDHSDYSAYVWGCVDHHQTIYVDASIQRRTTPAIVKDGIDLWCMYRPVAFFVESNHFQQLLLNLFELESRSRGVVTQFTKLRNTENKEVRIRRLEPFLQARRIRFKLGSVGASLLVEQLRQFPNAMHDDGPDALEVFLRGLLSIQRRNR